MAQNVKIKVSTEGTKKSSSDLKGVQGSLKSLGSTVAKVSGLYFGAKGLISAVSTVTNAYGIQEQAEKKLEVAIGRRSQSLLEQASALQKVTVFGDESILGVQASIGAFIKSEEQIKKASEATLDLASAMGMDLKSAGDLVAKTLGSSTNAMSRYGIEVEGAVGSNERLESMVTNVSRLFGGQATAQADTYSGSVQQLKNSLGDMAEDIGRIVVPIFEKLEPHLRTAIDFWSDYLKVGDDAKKGQSNLTPEMKKLNEEIEQQASLVDYISSESYRTFKLMKIRAKEAGRELSEQIKFENDEILRQQTILDDLRVKNKEIREENERATEIKKLENDASMHNMDIRRAELDLDIKFVEQKQIEKRTLLDNLKLRTKITEQDLRSASLTQGSAKDAMKAVIRAESMEQVAYLISSILRDVPFPANLILSAGAGATVSGLLDKALAKFADGGIVGGANPAQGDVIPALLTSGE